MRPLPLHNRPAFTLVELLVACIVLGIGVLGLASTAVAVARLTGDAARAGVAAERAQARMEAMRAGPCVAVSGSGSVAGVSEWWGATPAPEEQSLSDSVRYSEGAHHDVRTDALSSAAWCP